ncbi:hypothetical protein DFH11DRAFT_1566241 [Phellopilus nigrolimitatus]|nr:hypothetical protein DFH11DRAFT_1566241 [Phellopilus nigrolimitatus]
MRQWRSFVAWGATSYALQFAVPWCRSWQLSDFHPTSAEPFSPPCIIAYDIERKDSAKLDSDVLHLGWRVSMSTGFFAVLQSCTSLVLASRPRGRQPRLSRGISFRSL